MLGVAALVVGIILIAVGFQSKRESAIEVKQGLPAGKFSGIPFLVLGFIVAAIGVLILTGVIDLHASFT